MARHDVIFVKRLLSGGVDDACESRQLKSAYNTNSNSRPIDWIETLSETKREALKERLNQTETMIITCDANTIEAAQKEFGPEPLIIMPEHVQGLEGTLVVIYYPFTKKLIREINTHLKQIDTTKDCTNLPKNNGLNTSKFTMDLNKLIVAATRVVRDSGELVIYIGKHETHDSDLFFSLIKKSFSKHSLVLNEESKQATPLNTMSNEDWIKKLYKEGQEDTAKRWYAKHINADIAGFNTFVGAPIPQQEPIISQKSTRTKKPNTPNNTNPPSNTQKHNQASVLTSLSIQIFSSLDKLIHQLLEEYSFEKLATFFKHNDVSNRLIYVYKQKNGKQDETLFQTLISDATYLNVLNTFLRATPFAIRHFLVNEAILISINNALFNNEALCDAIYAFLNQLLEQQPHFLIACPDELMRIVTIQNLTHSPQCLTFVESVACTKPEMITTVLQKNATENLTDNNDLWCIQLLKSPKGCGVIYHVYKYLPELFAYINPKALIAEMQRIEQGETPLFFWLNTTIDGQLLFKALLLKYPQIIDAITQKMLFTRVSINNHRCNGTSMIFWLLKEENLCNTLSTITNKTKRTELAGTNLDNAIKQEKPFTHPDYPEKFVHGCDLLKVSKGNATELAKNKTYIPFIVPPRFMPYTTPKLFIPSIRDVFRLGSLIDASAVTIESTLKTILDSTNAQEVLFSRAMAEKIGASIFFHQSLYPAFLNLLQQNPKFCQFFTIERLNLFVTNKEFTSSLFIEILISCENNLLLKALLDANPELLSNIHEHNMLYAPIYLNEIDETVNFFTFLCCFKENIPVLDLLVQKEQLTPKFFHHLCYLNTDPSQDKDYANLSVFEIALGTHVDMLNCWLKSEPKFASYMRMEHFLPAERESKLTTLLNSKAGIDFLIFVLILRNDLLVLITLDSKNNQVTSKTTPLFAKLCQFEQGKKVLQELLVKTPALGNKLSKNQLAMISPPTKIQIPITVQTKPVSHSESQLAAMLKTVLTMFKPFIVKNLLTKNPCDTCLFTPMPIRCDQPETLFDIILDNQSFLEVFNTVLQEDRFLATGAMITDKMPINKIIKKMGENTQSNKQFIILFEILIGNQPNLSGKIAPDLLNPQLLYQLSSDETGRRALHAMIEHNPNCLDALINQMATLKSSNQPCGFCELLESQLGCGIISIIHAVNQQVLQSINPTILAKKSASNQAGQTPIYFWLSSTEAGQVFLFKLFKLYPQLPAEIKELSLTQTIKHEDTHYNNTSTLFWLTSELGKDNTILKVISAAGNIDSKLLNTPLKHPFYGQTIINSRTVLDKNNSYREVLFSACFISQTYFCLTHGSHLAWTKEEIDLLASVLNQQTFQKNLPNLLKHKNAQSLLFDGYDTEKHSVFQAIMMNKNFRAGLKYTLKQHPEYYKIFTFEQMKVNTALSIYLFLVVEDREFLTLLIKNQPSLKKALNAKKLLQYLTYDKLKTNLLEALLCDNKAEILSMLDLQQILTPALVAQLFDIKNRGFENATKNKTHHCDSFDFAVLHINVTDIPSKWVKYEPRLLNYLTEAHLFAEQYVAPQKAAFLLFLTIADGNAILYSALERNPNLLNRLSFGQLVATTKEYNSILFNLSNGTWGHKILSKIIPQLTEVFESIRPNHLMDRGSYAQNSILENLCLYDDNLEIFSMLLQKPTFMNAFKSEHLFSRLDNLYGLCRTKKGIELFSLILKQHPMEKAFTKELLFKLNPKLPQGFSFIAAFLSYGDKNIVNTLQVIFKSKHAFLGLNKEKFEKLSTKEFHKELINTQIKYFAQNNDARQPQYLQEAIALMTKRVNDEIDRDEDENQTSSFKL